MTKLKEFAATTTPAPEPTLAQTPTTASGLATIEPAAGGPGGAGGGGSDVDCANNFLDNRPCGPAQ